MRLRVGRHAVAVADQIRLQPVQPCVAIRIRRARRRQRKHVAARHTAGRGFLRNRLAHPLVFADQRSLLQARDVERLARRAEHHRQLVRMRQVQDAAMRVRRVDKIRVDFVADQRHTIFIAQVDDARKLFLRPCAAAGIMRRAEHDHFGLAGGQLALRIGEIQRVAAALVAEHRAAHHPAAAFGDRGVKRAVHRREDEHAVARLGQRADAEPQFGDDARPHLHVLRLKADPVAALPVIAQRPRILLAAERIAPRALLGHPLHRIRNGGRGAEIHIRHPHGDHLRVVVLVRHAVPLLAVRMAPLKPRIEKTAVKFHGLFLLCFAKRLSN